MCVHCVYLQLHFFLFVSNEPEIITAINALKPVIGL